MLSITLTVVDENKLLVFNLPFPETHHLVVRSGTWLPNEPEGSANGP